MGSDQEVEGGSEIAIWRVHEFFVRQYGERRKVDMGEWMLEHNKRGMPVERVLVNVIGAWCNSNNDILNSYVEGASPNVPALIKTIGDVKEKGKRACYGENRKIVFRKRVDIGPGSSRALGKTALIVFAVEGEGMVDVDGGYEAVFEKREFEWMLVNGSNDRVVNNWRFAGEEKVIRIEKLGVKPGKR